MIARDARWAILAGGPATLSKGADRYPQGLAPKALIKGKGAYVWGDDGRRYLDPVAALGPILLGHCDPAVNRAVRRQLRKGVSLTLPSPLEVDVAEHLVELIPCAQAVRFAKNGKDVTEAAVRLARAVTGRKHVYYCGYSGGFTDYLSTTDKNGGVLPEVAPYNHQIPWEQVRQPGVMAQGAAAYVLEVPPRPWRMDDVGETLRYVRDLATRNGTVFILDEVVTGLRYPGLSAQAYYQVTPDLACFSKGLGNGHAVAALVGQRELMRAFEGGQVFLSTTFGGEVIGFAAAMAVLEVMRDQSAQQHLYRLGRMLGNRLQCLIEHYHIPATLLGNGARMLVTFHEVEGVATADELKTLWQQEMVVRNILWGGPCFPMVCWTAHVVERIVDAASDVCAVIAEALHAGSVVAALRCPVISDVFGQRYQAKGHAAIVW